MKKLGFTLAEVLITLVIIGVIAAMTVPTLMNNTNAQEFRSALKKAISGVNQALTLNYALEGLSAQDYSSATDIVDNVFKKRMSVLTTSDTMAAGCTTANSTFTTADGAIFCVTNWATSDASTQTGKCNSYNTVPCTSDNTKANLWIDVNGDRKPNRATANSAAPKDIYQAQIYAQKVIPYGNPSQQVMFDKEVNSSFSLFELLFSWVGSSSSSFVS